MFHQLHARAVETWLAPSSQEINTTICHVERSETSPCGVLRFARNDSLRVVILRSLGLPLNDGTRGRGLLRLRKKETPPSVVLGIMYVLFLFRHVERSETSPCGILRFARNDLLPIVILRSLPLPLNDGTAGRALSRLRNQANQFIRRGLPPPHSMGMPGGFVGKDS